MATPDTVRSRTGLLLMLAAVIQIITQAFCDPGKFIIRLEILVFSSFLGKIVDFFCEEMNRTH